MDDVDALLEQIRARLDLEAETEFEVLEEIRVHLEEAVEHAIARGSVPQAALAEVAARFGVDEAARELQAAHAGWGALEGIAAAALPVLLALALRWLVFAPDGTAVEWREMLNRPAFWGLAAVAFLFPLVFFPRRRYALLSWAVFWGLSVIMIVFPALRW